MEETDTAPAPEAPTPMAVEKPLDRRSIAPGLSLIGRTGNGLSHAFTRLSVQGKGISSMDAVSGYPHLRHLDLSKNAIPNVDALQGLDYLISANFSDNRIDTIPSFFDTFKYLQILDMSRNVVASVDMTKAPLLVSLNLNHNALTALTLQDFPELTQLEAKHNKLSSIDVSGAPKLETLYLSGNSIVNVEGLTDCLQLTHLYLRDNVIQSLGSFMDGQKNLPALSYLNLRGNQISKFSELDKLRSLPRLTVLVLRDNPIAQESNYRLEVLFRLPNLERLDKDVVTEDDRDELEIYKTNRPSEPSTDEGITNREVDSEGGNDTEAAQGIPTEAD